MSKKKLILMYPNLRWQKEDIVTTWHLNPTTLCLLAAMVRDDVELKIIDAQFYNMTREEFKNEVDAYRPDYVGISVLTSEYQDILDIASALVKSISDNIIVIAGGVHVTTMPEYVMNNKNIDYSVIGEGEYVLKGLIMYLNGEGRLPEEGLAYRKDGKVVIQKRSLVNDLTKLPRPAYDLVDFKLYTKSEQRSFNSQRPPEYPFVRMVTTRGCPFGCVFCQVDMISGKRVRARDPKDVVDELSFLKKEYNIRSVFFDDDNILMGKDDYAKKLFKLMIDRRLGLKWVGISVALFALTEELLDLMKESGCVEVNVAIESGNERVLREVVKKPIKDLKAVPDMIKKIKDRRISCIANIVIGFPGETWDEIRESISFAEHCGADYIKIFVAVPLYKTELYNLAMRMNLLECKDGFPTVDWRYGQIKSNEWTPKDISILRAYEWDRINFAPDRIEKVAGMFGVSKDDLKVIRKKTRDNLFFEEAS